MSEVRLDGRVLTVPLHERLPAGRCLVCAGRDHVETRSRTFVYRSTGGSFLVMAISFALCFLYIWPGLLALVIGTFVIRRAAHLDLPVCGPCHDRDTTARVGATLVCLGGLVLLPLGLPMLMREVGLGDVALIGFFGGVIAALILVYVCENHWVLRRSIVLRGVAGIVATLWVPYPDLTREALGSSANP